MLRKPRIVLASAVLLAPSEGLESERLFERLSLTDRAHLILRRLRSD